MSLALYRAAILQCAFVKSNPVTRTLTHTTNQHQIWEQGIVFFSFLGVAARSWRSRWEWTGVVCLGCICPGNRHDAAGDDDLEDENNVERNFWVTFIRKNPMMRTGGVESSSTHARRMFENQKHGQWKTDMRQRLGLGPSVVETNYFICHPCSICLMGG